MKVVHVITRLILGGAQENTLLTCLETARLGHDVTLLAGPPEGPEGSLVEAAQSAPIRTVLVPAMGRPVRPFRDAVAYFDLLKHIREIRPDVVHTHSSKAGILGRRAAHKAGVPCVVHTIHGLAFDCYAGRLARRCYVAAERRAGRWSHRQIAVCRDMAERAETAGVAPGGSIVVVYSAMDTERFRAAEGEREAVRAAWGVGPDAFVFVKVARLFDLKGHAFVLPAFTEVAREVPEAHLVLVGDGRLRPALEAEARRLGVADRVRFEGLVPREHVPGCLWAADAVVHASLREGLARVLAHAGLCRRPVVTYEVGGAVELVDNGVNGFCLPPPPARFARVQVRAPRQAWAPLAAAMGRLAADPAAARAMGRAWPEERLRRFDYREATPEVVRVYDEVLGDGGRP